MALSVIASCTKESKVLVLYYSQEGSTKVVAEEISNQIGADLEAFDVEEPYTGNFNETIARCLEEQSAGKVPALAALDINLDDYDTVFLGYPIWFGTYAPPVAALLKEKDFSGKKIVPFCTFGSGGLNTSVADLKNALKDSEILDGYGVRAARLAAVPQEVERFLIEGGFKEGVLEELAEYSEQAPVTEEEIAIFEEACSDYQFPLGTPVTAGSRTASYGTDYHFMVESTAPDGSVSKSQIYVTVSDSGKAEFTQVVR